MPVSLSEWRVRIGTFVHWIREYEVKERRERLLKERIRRLKVLCKRLEEKMGDSGEESEDDKSRQDGPDSKGCPHKTANIRSSGNSSDIKDLLTSCDQCIQELLTASDSHIKEILTPSDTCIKQLLTPRRESLERIRRLKVLCERLEAKMGDSGEDSEDDNSRQDGSDPKGCPHKTANTRSSGNSSDIKDLLSLCDLCIQDLLTARDSHIKEILTPSCCSIKELITPNDCSIKSPNTLNGSTIKDVITANDSGIKELLTTNDSEIQILVGANDASRIQDLVKSNDDSRIQELLKTNYSSIRDPITPKYCSIKEVIVSKNDSTKPLDIPNASSIKDLITPNDSSIIGLITSEYYNVKDLITSNDSKVNSLLTPNETNIKWLIMPDDDYIEEQLAQDYDYVKTCTSDDESIEQDRQVGDLEEQQMSDFSISPRHSLSDASLRELLTSYPSTKGLRTPTDYSNTDLLIQTSYIKDHETQSDGSVKELLSQGSRTTVCQPFAPCDDFLVELLKPTVYASKDVPSIDLCCHEPDRQNEPFSEESGELPHFVGKEQHPQPDTITKEATDDELLKKHRTCTSSGSCKKSQTETSILMAVKRSPVVPFVSSKNCICDRYGEKQMRESASSCHGLSLKSKTDLICGQIPPLSELLLLKSGDVELNPGPREAAGWSLDLEREVLSLVKDVSPVHYYDLCNALDFSHAQSQVILTKNLLDVSNALSEVICSWGVKQRDGSNYKRLLAEKLKSVNLDALATKLGEGEETVKMNI
ncbi:uncharacterized protein LOC105440667 [Strongylocentrotus purpuratus]|uniref:Uncharacterized protein n=1 Tax=Strongylocentrotus purpuratus TaxID=7668 RepID=A0A7M7T0S3_STRPU|nr:uncharacterized protein LOC105440667 [Strongylocentrotus purpuratus]